VLLASGGLALIGWNRLRRRSASRVSSSVDKEPNHAEAFITTKAYVALGGDYTLVPCCALSSWTRAMLAAGLPFRRGSRWPHRACSTFEATARRVAVVSIRDQIVATLDQTKYLHVGWGQSFLSSHTRRRNSSAWIR